MPLTKPASLSDLKGKLDTLYSSTRARVVRWRKAYDKDFRSAVARLPEGVPIHESSTARNLIDNLADQIRTDEPRVTFKAVSSSIKAQRQKELMEMLGESLLKKIPRYTVVDPAEQVKKDLLRDGMACLKYTIDVDAIPVPPVRADFTSKLAYSKALKDWRMARASAWFYDVRSVDPMQVYVAPGRKQPPIFVLEYQRRLAFEVRQDYPHWTDPKSPKRGVDDLLRLTDWLEYWDKDNYIVEVDGERIIDKTNPYKAIPYEWSYNGMGRHDYQGQLSSLGESVLEGNMGEFEAEVRVKTAMDAQWQFHVFPRLITTIDAVRARKMFMKGPGRIITIADMEQKPEWLVTPPPNAQMTQFLSEVKANISARFPAAINQRPEGVEAGIHQALLQGQALRPLQPIKNTLNRMYTRLLNGMLWQTKQLNLDVNVFGSVEGVEKERMVTPEDILHFNYEVKFEATDPAEDEKKLLVGLALMRVPRLLSRKSFREVFAAALGIKHEQEEQQTLEEITLDQIAEQGLILQQAMENLQQLQADEQQQGVLEAAQSQFNRAGAQAGVAAEETVTGARERGMAAATGQGSVSPLLTEAKAITGGVP